MPCVDNHSIDYIELWANGKLVEKTELQASISRGFDLYKVNLRSVTKLTVIATRNLGRFNFYIIKSKRNKGRIPYS
jgi:aspartate 1-decarboxylase